MKRIILALCLAGLPATAQESPAPPSDVDEGLSLLEQGARSILRGLMTEMQPTLDEMQRQLGDIGPALRDLSEGMDETLARMRPMAEDLLRLMDNIGNYQAPEILPNGDIIIRRKPDVPKPPAAGEIDL